MPHRKFEYSSEQPLKNYGFVHVSTTTRACIWLLAVYIIMTELFL